MDKIHIPEYDFSPFPMIKKVCFLQISGPAMICLKTEAFYNIQPGWCSGKKFLDKTRCLCIIGEVT